MTLYGCARSYVKIMKSDGQLPKSYLNYLDNPSAYNFQAMQLEYPDKWAAADEEAVQGTLVKVMTPL